MKANSGCTTALFSLNVLVTSTYDIVPDANYLNATEKITIDTYVFRPRLEIEMFWLSTGAANA